MQSRIGLLVVGASLASQVVVWAAEVPVAVSPGRADTGAIVESRCPTFNWGTVRGAQSYELVIYQVAEEGEDTEPIVQQSFPGSVHGWTPAMDRCLERGGQYAWSVRAIGRRGLSKWSAPSLFKVADGPSETELIEALAVVRAYLATQDGESGEDLAEVRAEREGGTDTKEGDPVEVILLEPVPFPALTRDEWTPPLKPGQNLVGPTQLTVDGGVVATSFSGDGSTLTNLPPASSVICSGCVGSADIANGSVGSSDIGSSAVRGSELSTIRVVSVECNGECGDSSLSEICGPGFEGLAVDCQNVDEDNQAGTINCGGDNVCYVNTVFDEASLSNFCDDISGWDANVYCIAD